MAFASKHNKGGIDWNIDTTDFTFLTREDSYKKDPETIHKVRGLYINKKSSFGDHPVAICDGYFLDLPDYMTDDVKEILKDEEDVETIKAGKVGIKIEEFYQEKFKKTCYGARWVDLI